MLSLSRCARGAVPLALAMALAVGANAQQVPPPCPQLLSQASRCPVGPLTLANAVDLAQRQGLSAEASRDALVEARARNAAFNARLLPRVALSSQAANYNHAFVPVPQADGSTAFRSQSQNQSSMGLVVSQPLPWLGSTLSVGSYLSRLDATVPIANGQTTSRTYHSTPFLISLTQDLLKPRTVLWDSRAQDLRASLAERQYVESREDLAINTASAFFDYYAATVALRNATSNVAVNDTLYTLNKGRFEVGKIGENDLLQSELQLLRARASLDGAKLEPVKTIPVGQRPRGIVLSKDEKSLYICASDSDHIEVLDLATDKIARTLPSGADPEYFALDPTGKLLYVANEDSNLVTVVDINRAAVVTEIPVGVEPEGMGISPDGKYLVNTSETTNMAHLIDTAKREVVGNILVDSRPRRAEWTADGAQFWVSAEIGGTVSVIDARKREIVKRITFAVYGVPSEAIQPVGIAITRDRKLAFVALGPANRVAVIDAQSYEVMRYLLVGQRVWSLAFNPDQSRVYTTNGVSNDISVIDVTSLKVIKSVPVGQLPWGVVSRP